MLDEFKIRLNIAGKGFSITIERADEEKYRRAERDVNALVAMYKTRFRAQPEDYLAMAAIQIATSNVEKDMSRSLGEDIDRLVEIDKELDAYLNSLQ